MAIEDFLTVAAPTNELIETDAVIVGAGPVGLFQVFELGLLEIKCHVIDSLRNVADSASSCIPPSRSTTSPPFRFALPMNSRKTFSSRTTTFSRSSIWVKKSPR